MNLFQFGWLGCLALPYFHIYFNKQCRVGTRKHMLGVHTRLQIRSHTRLLRKEVSKDCRQKRPYFRKEQSRWTSVGCCVLKPSVFVIVYI